MLSIATTYKVVLLQFLQQVIASGDHDYDGSGSGVTSCAGQPCLSEHKQYCCGDIQQCCSKLQYELLSNQYYEYESMTTNPPDNSWCYNEFCTTTYKPYCCHRYRMCCDAFYFAISEKNTYMGTRLKCSNVGKQYTGITCPPESNHAKLYCCGNGYACCTTSEKRHQDSHSRTNYSDDGVKSIGGIAGFVFMGVIILATVLTLLTRYFKIKVRRNHARAGIQSSAYINARNQTSNDGNNNEGQNEPESVHHHRPVPGMMYAQHPSARTEESSQDEDEVNPPPTYQEALASCPVVADTSQNSNQNNTSEQGVIDVPFMLLRQLARPSTRARPTETEFESIELNNTISKTWESPETIPDNGAGNTYENERTITLPKQEETCA